MLTIRPEFPVDPTVLTILQAVAAETASADIGCMIVGATARDLLLTHVFGMSARRATHDLDFAVVVENWGQFEQLKSRLLTRKGFKPYERMKQRLYYRIYDNDPGYPVDLIPFGGVTDGTNEVAWPPDMQVTMNVAGYHEVLKAAEQIEIGGGCVINVASLAGLALLKLVAWSDRGLANPKDAHDLYQIMSHYAAAGNIDRLYDPDDAFVLLEAADHDPDIAGACLLGKDVARLAQETTYQQLIDILSRDYDRLTFEMTKSIRHAEDAQAAIDVRMRQFRTGINMRGTRD